MICQKFNRFYFFFAGFAFGLLIHSILQISYQIFFLSQTGSNIGNCASYTTLVLDILFPIYSLFVLFFIFKYMNVIINEYRGISRIMLMHAIGTSLAFWVFTIVRETSDAITMAYTYDMGEKGRLGCGVTCYVLDHI